MNNRDYFTPEAISDSRKMGRQRQIQKVYFITDGDAVKVGFSHSVAGRLDALQTAHSKPLREITNFPGTLNDEKRVHAELADLRLRGEWFRADPKIDAVIAKLEEHRKLLPLRASITQVLDGTVRYPGRPGRPPTHAAPVFARWLEDNKRRLSPIAIEKAVRLHQGLLIVDWHRDRPAALGFARKYAEEDMVEFQAVAS